MAVKQHILLCFALDTFYTPYNEKPWGLRVVRRYLCLWFFVDILWICAAVVLCCWLFKFIFGAISGATRTVKDTFDWSKDKVKGKEYR